MPDFEVHRRELPHYNAHVAILICRHVPLTEDQEQRLQQLIDLETIRLLNTDPLEVPGAYTTQVDLGGP